MPLKVLYVDDEGDIRLLLRGFLEKKGYLVLDAADARAGFDLALSQHPDVVITDVMMPNESGFSLCKRLKANPSTARIPIIVVTVLDEEATALAAGATAFLSKPFTGRQIFETLAAVIHPADGVSLLDQALAHLRAQDLHQARADFLTLIENHPDDGAALWARYYLARLDERDHNLERAMDGYRAVLAKDPGFWRAWSRLGDIHAGKGNCAAAILQYRRSLELWPNQPDVQRRLGEVTTSAGSTA